jgi:lipid-binding SYLF domain-containing protein
MTDWTMASTRWSARAASFIRSGLLLLAAAAAAAQTASADELSDTADLFRNAGQSAAFFNHCYGYAIFPTVGKAAFILGAAHGDGKVFEGHKYIGDASLTQVSVGAQAGGQAYSEVIFFQDRRTLKDFIRGDFEFSADVSAVVITSGASATTATSGTSAGISGGKRDAATAAGYFKGVAVFTIIKGGAMVQVSLGGQKFSFRPRAD